jgi:hypothetical protein
MSQSKIEGKANIDKINLSAIIEDIFMVLSTKEKSVIVKRFSLNNQPRQTLESIGQEFSVTRERIRQIEKIALTKLRRTSSSSRLSGINEICNEILQENGGVANETKIISEVLKRLSGQNDADTNLIKLSLHINPDIQIHETSATNHQFWRENHILTKDISEILKIAHTLLQKKGDVISEDEICLQIQNSIEGGARLTVNTITSVLGTDKKIKKVENAYGFQSWRHINPQSIRDKAYIVLKKAAEPLHFVEIANRISSYGFDKKVVTTQAVHNELIRYDQFVLVGRGLYALKEWGFKKGTVSDVIEGILKEKGPLPKNEIIEEVLKQRQVKKGTISLNLQKNNRFVRIGRAVYALKTDK